MSRAGGAAGVPVMATWRHRVTRVEGGESVTLDLAPTDPLQPGDTLEILLELPDG